MFFASKYTIQKTELNERNRKESRMITRNVFSPLIILAACGQLLSQEIILQPGMFVPGAQPQSGPALRPEAPGKPLVARPGIDTRLPAGKSTPLPWYQADAYLNDFRVNSEADSSSFSQSRAQVACSQWPMIAWAVWIDGRSPNGDVYIQRYDSLMNKSGGNSRVNDDTTQMAQNHPAIDCDSSGNAVVVWYDSRYPYGFGQRFGPSGRLGTNFRIGPDTISGTYDYPDVAMLPGGGFVVSSALYHNGLGRQAVLASRFNAGGSLTGHSYADSAAGNKGSTACGAAGNRVIFAWFDNRNGQWDLYVRVFDLAGNPVSAAIRATEPAAVIQDYYNCRPALAVGDTGQFCVAWQDYRNGNNDIYAQRFDRSGTAQGGNFKVNSDAGSSWQGYPQATYVRNGFGTGSLYISWLDLSAGSRIMYRGYDIYGAPLGEGALVNTAGYPGNHHGFTFCYRPPTNNYAAVVAWDAIQNSQYDVYACNINVTPYGSRCNDDAVGANQNEPSVAADSTGRWAVAWMDDRRPDLRQHIYVRPFNAAGSPLTGEARLSDTLMNSSGAFSPILAVTAGGDFICAWYGSRSVTGVLGTYDAGPTGGNIRLSADTATAWTKMYPAAAMDNDTRFIVAWLDSRNSVYYDLYCRGFGPGAAARTGQDLKVNLAGTEAQGHRPKAVALGAGRFALVYSQKNGSYADLYCRLAEVGTDTVTFVGAPFKVSDNPAAVNAVYCGAGADTAGNFLAAWYDYRNYNVMARWFDRNGVAQGAGLDVGDNYTYPMNTNVIVDRQGRAAVTWAQNVISGADPDVMARAYNADRSPFTPVFRVNNDPTRRYQGIPAVTEGGGNFYFAWEDGRHDTCGTDIFAKGYTWAELGVSSAPGSEPHSTRLRLEPNRPNPFGQFTTIDYQLPRAGKVSLKVYNIAGQLVRTLVDGSQASGFHVARWDGRDERGREIAAGVYVARLDACGSSAARKLIRIE